MSDTAGGEELAAQQAGEAMANLSPLADQIAGNVRLFLDGVERLAAGDGGDEAVPLLLLEVSQILLAGAQLGATTDVILPGNWEPEVGDDPDLDALRVGLARQVPDCDDYAERSIRTPTPAGRRSGCPMTSRPSPPTSSTGSSTIGPTASWRPCGGGSTPTSTTGALTPVPPCARCTR